MMDYTSVEMMTVAASRALQSNDICFAGVGPPSEACNLARLVHAPGITLIYESGAVRARPDVLPLSVGDGELCETALNTVSVAEMFRYWLQGGNIPIGFLGAAQIDRFGNINTTVVGDYRHPRIRLPGGGGAPEIAGSCGQVYIIVKQSRRGFVRELDFVTTFGHGSGGKSRQETGFATAGPTIVFTDMAVWRPDPRTKELSVVSLHAGVSREQMQNSVGWEIKYADKVEETPVPTPIELERLRALHSRTRAAHSGRHQGLIKAQASRPDHRARNTG
ncbi:MAG: CoA-transferase subunit beta [Rhodobacteraceae bacterium]|nr:CoA-transferase subunit beta [Paracoccaceae bacterium]